MQALRTGIPTTARGRALRQDFGSIDLRYALSTLPRLLMQQRYRWFFFAHVTMGLRCAFVAWARWADTRPAGTADSAQRAATVGAETPSVAIRNVARDGRLVALSALNPVLATVR